MKSLRRFFKRANLGRVYLLALLGASSVPAQELIDRVVARVDDAVITETQLERKANDLRNLYALRSGGRTARAPSSTEIRRQALQRLIDEEILLKRFNQTFRINAAQRAAQIRVDAYIKDTIERLGDTEFKGRLAEERQSLEEFRDTLIEEQTRMILVQQARRSWIDEFLLTPVSVTQIEKYIEDHPEISVRNAALEIQMLLLRVPEDPTPEQDDAVRRKAQRILNQARAGEPFEDLVALHSEHLQSRENDGAMELSSPQSPFPEFAPLFDLEPGQFYEEPIRIPVGWCVVRVTEKRSLNNLARRAMAEERFEKAFEEAKDEATIVYDRDLFSAAF